MTIFDTDPALRWLFCFTHPDDELSICAWVRRLRLARADVFLSWTHSTPEREAEARDAAELLGVPQDRLFFFASPDGKVLEDIPRLLPRFAEMATWIKPDRVVCGAYEQGHLDHDSTNYAIHRVYQGPVFEVPWYHTYAHAIQTVNRFADPVGEAVLSLTPEESSLKRVLARLYPSQRIADLLIWYELWSILRGRPSSLAKTERMRVQTHFEYSTPNLPRAAAERVRRSRHWLRWESAISEYSRDL